ncbi:MAG: hypothetical protein ACE5QV_07750, partial [Fidelibacterota bacterium]
METKYHIRTENIESRFPPIGRFRIIRDDGCVNCGKCASVCIYDVHKRSSLDYRKMAEPVDYRCKNCFMCIQNCVKGVLSIVPSPEYLRLGDDLYTPEIITGLMAQAESGQIPVLGAGYGGSFSGDGFDGLWTDMSEIVRPTRDGIHGREYISTVVDLGRKPLHVKDLKFDEYGNPLTNIPPTAEIKIPIILQMPPFLNQSENVLLSIVKSAAETGTFAIMDMENYSQKMDPYFNHIIKSLSPEDMPWKQLVNLAKSHSILEFKYSPEIGGLVTSLKKINPDLIIFIRFNLLETTASIVQDLYTSGVDVIHLHVERYSYKSPPLKVAVEIKSRLNSLPEIIREVHNQLV